MKAKLYKCLILLIPIFSLFSQPSIKRDPNVVRIINEISADSIKRNIEKLVSFYTRHSLSDTLSPTRGIGAARRWLKSELERYSRQSGGRMKVEYDEFIAPTGPRVPKPTKMVNVIATLPGKIYKDKIYIVSAHYDSRAGDALDSTSFAPGANDDGSGTAGVLELARVMSKYEFDFTIMFVLFAGEEQGLLGSRHFAKKLKDSNIVVLGVLNNDIIGNTEGGNGIIDNTQVRVFSEGLPLSRDENLLRLISNIGLENDSPSRQLARYLKDVAERYFDNFKVNLIFRRDRFLRGGDHTPFNEQGFPAVRISEMNENYSRQHQNVRTEKGIKYGDLPEFVDFEYCANVVRLNAVALYHLANAPMPPQNPVIKVSELEYDTTLRWDLSNENDLAGYNILIRETTSPFWQKKIFVGRVNEFTLKNVSKDNFIFGIQSVDIDGNESLVVVPMPSR
ncbi:M28 family peptidase [Candidatus Chrysopegis kryptomonas]|uniref:Peptidase family M28 n=1 Tax=Candidatus Chryseopegocella kryptomonas TaxID=1633643 RepID=A0A0P1MS82_9BACT|nr:M28 family peptidase [Candidatus Chrysopegis kryptomonas]CUS98745.1 Peptidase family M28 [Candidatus Chrysopegis kryptomonas]